MRNKVNRFGLRAAKSLLNFGHSECCRIKLQILTHFIQGENRINALFNVTQDSNFWSNILLQSLTRDLKVSSHFLFNPTALRKAKIAYNFGLSECYRVNSPQFLFNKSSASFPSPW